MLGCLHGFELKRHEYATPGTRDSVEIPAALEGSLGDVVFLADEWLNARPWDQLLALAVLGAVASVPLAVKLGNSFQRRRTERLRREFGPDYDIAVNQHGDWRKAERELKKRLDERRRRAERM